MRYYSSHVDKIDATVTSHRSAEKPTRDNRPLVRTGYEYEYFTQVVLYGTVVVSSRSSGRELVEASDCRRNMRQDCKEPCSLLAQDFASTCFESVQ